MSGNIHPAYCSRCATITRHQGAQCDLCINRPRLSAEAERITVIIEQVAREWAQEHGATLNRPHALALAIAAVYGSREKMAEVMRRYRESGHNG